MQATRTKRFVRSRAGGMAAAFSIVIGGIIAVSALAIGDVASNESAVESSRMMPNAYTSVGQGEGLIDAANTRSAADAPLKAFSSPGQGEGLVDGTNRRFDQIPYVAPPPLSHEELRFIEDNTIFQTPYSVPGMSYGD